jgi:heme oxygenase
MTTSAVDIEPAPSSRRAIRTGILERLKIETAADHAAIEDATGIMSPRLGLDDYRTYLASTFGYYAAVEPKLREAGVWPALQLSASGRQKLPLLRRDLRALGVTELGGLPRCESPPEWSNVAEAVGGAYVLEGSTLGGRVISRHVQQRFGARVPRAFLECYGTRTGESWQAFRVALCRFASSREIETGIIDGARSTFQSFTRWLQHHQRSAVRAAG